jgi:NAD+ synthase (glutamine-hydrolysing)
VYLNLVGGQDELVFDGGSFTMDADGLIQFRAPPFVEGMHRVVLEVKASGIVPLPGEMTEIFSTEQSVYEALVCGTRDYVEKHGFPGVCDCARQWPPVPRL